MLATLRSWYSRGVFPNELVQAKLAPEAPLPGTPASTTVTRAPAAARRCATHAPTTPAPTTIAEDEADAGMLPRIVRDGVGGRQGRDRGDGGARLSGHAGDATVIADDDGLA